MIEINIVSQNLNHTLQTIYNGSCNTGHRLAWLGFTYSLEAQKVLGVLPIFTLDPAASELGFLSRISTD